MLCCDNFSNLDEKILTHYEKIPSYSEKLILINELKVAILNRTFLENLSNINHKIVLTMILKICTTV